jgi:hypothetical protein
VSGRVRRVGVLSALVGQQEEDLTALAASERDATEAFLQHAHSTSTAHNDGSAVSGGSTAGPHGARNA